MRHTAAFLVLALVLAGCGGSDGDPATPTTAATTAATTGNGDTPTTAGAPTTDNGSDGDDISMANCPELLTWAMDSAAASQAAFAGGGTNAAGAEFTADYFQEFADRAPGEIRDEMRVFADAYSNFWETLADLGLDFTDPETLSTMDQSTVQQLEAAASVMDGPEVEQALETIESFFEQECG